MSDYDTFWELIDAERNGLWRLARGITRNYDDACDLMSETVLAAYKSYPKLRAEIAFRKFLGTIAVRINRRKIWRNRIFLPLQVAQDLGYEVGNESSYDLDLLPQLLKLLPARQREALVLFEITELSIIEIQQIQGGTVSGVKSRLVRARQNLRRLLADQGLPPEPLVVMQKHSPAPNFSL